MEKDETRCGCVMDTQPFVGQLQQQTARSWPSDVLVARFAFFNKELSSAGRRMFEQVQAYISCVCDRGLPLKHC